MQTKTRNVQRRELLDISGFMFIDELIQTDFLPFETGRPSSTTTTLSADETCKS